jgi:ATP-dependent DNA helicase RecG
MVNVDDDKIEVLSPGEPLCTLYKLNSFTAPSVSRNPKIAHIFFDMGLVEERGFGLEELSKMESLGLKKPTFEMDGDLLKTTIYRGNEPTSIIADANLKGLKQLQEHKVLTSSQYEKIANVSDRTARRHLNDLVKANKATKKGNGPSTEYSIK